MYMRMRIRYIYRLLVAGSTGGTGVRRRRKSGFLERLLPAARDRAVPPSGWRGELTLVTRHGLGAPGFVEVPRARRRGQTRTRGMEVARRWRRVRGLGARAAVGDGLFGFGGGAAGVAILSLVFFGVINYTRQARDFQGRVLDTSVAWS